MALLTFSLPPDAGEKISLGKRDDVRASSISISCLRTPGASVQRPIENCQIQCDMSGCTLQVCQGFHDSPLLFCDKSCVSQKK